MTDARSTRVLIANDQEWSARSVDSFLAGAGYQVQRVYTGEQAVSQAIATRPDFIILDLQLPDIDGLEVCRRLRATEEIGAATPIVITTAGGSGRNRLLDALAAGAWDFFGQPIDGELLLLKIRTYLAAKDALEQHRDPALPETEDGLYSRAALAARAREVVAHARRRGQPVSCVAFRPIVPDEVDPSFVKGGLDQRIATALKESARSADAVGRAGPLTYFVLAPGTGADGAVRMANRLTNGIAARFAQLGATLGLRFQIGFAVTGNGSGEDTIDGDDLLRRASQSLGIIPIPASS